jgi:hypothetical protein
MNKRSFYLNLLTSNWQGSHGSIASKWGDPSEGSGNFGFSLNKFLAIKSGLSDSVLLLDYTNQCAYFYTGSSDRINALYNSYQGGKPSASLVSNMWGSYVTEWNKDPVLRLLDKDITFMKNEEISVLNELRSRIVAGETVDDSVYKVAELMARESVGDECSIFYLGENMQAAPSDGTPVYVVQKNWGIPILSPNTAHVTLGDDGIFSFDSSSWSKSGLIINNESSTLGATGEAISKLTIVDKADNYRMTINVSGDIADIWGSEGDDTITDGDGDTYIMPLGGDNIINGGSGYDTLDYFYSPPSNKPSVSGFSFSSIFKGMRASDKGINASFATGTVRTPTGVDKFTNIEGIEGSQYDDHLVGNSVDNEFNGAGGNDYIDGGGGIDTINYDYSHEGVLVNISEKAVSINKLNPVGFLNDSIGNSMRNNRISPQTAIDGLGGQDHIRNIENINGSSFSDVLIGNNLNNVIMGGWPSDANQVDTILGSGGADLITVWGSAKVNYESIRDSMPNRSGKELSDVIVAWRIGEEQNGIQSKLFIDLTAIDANSLVRGNQEFQWSPNLNFPNAVDKSSKFSGRAGELILENIVYKPEPEYIGLGKYATEAASIQGDINGDRIADFEVKIIGVSSQTFDNVILYM